MKCPQGCVHSVFGSDTMQPVEQIERADPPSTIEHGGETVILEQRVRLFHECRVCGRRIDA